MDSCALASSKLNCQTDQHNLTKQCCCFFRNMPCKLTDSGPDSELSCFQGFDQFGHSSLSSTPWTLVESWSTRLFERAFRTNWSKWRSGNQIAISCSMCAQRVASLNSDLVTNGDSPLAMRPDVFCCGRFQASKFADFILKNSDDSKAGKVLFLKLSASRCETRSKVLNFSPHVESGIQILASKTVICSWF